MLDSFTSFVAVALGVLTGVVVKLMLDAHERRQVALFTSVWASDGEQPTSAPLALAAPDSSPASAAPSALAAVGLAPVRAEAEPSPEDGA